MLNSYRFERHVKERMAAARVPGLAVAVVRDREIIYARGLGVTSVEEGGLPTMPRTLFPVGSLTKPLTGTAVMRLLEQGLLELDTPVREYVPWLTLRDQGAVERITLRMLLSHTAGLPNVFEPFGRCDLAGLEAYVRDEVATLRLVAPPGKLFAYSNPGIDVAGHVLEVVTGKRYTDLMRELVFEPLEMDRTTFDRRVAMSYPLAQEHVLDREGSLRVRHRFADNTAHYPAGFVITTALDLANFALMHLDEGRFGDGQFLSPESVAEMHRAQADARTPVPSGYGLTFFTGDHRGRRRVGHGGGLGAFSSSLFMLPDEGTAVILVSNRMSPELVLVDLATDIADELLGPREEWPETVPAHEDRSAWPFYVGTYVGPYTGVVDVRVVDGQLTLSTGDDVIPLKAVRGDIYTGPRQGDKASVSVAFIREGEALVQYILVDGFPCSRAEVEITYKVGPELLQSYAGRYGDTPSDPEPLLVSVRDGRLHIGWESSQEPCIPLDDARFACSWGVFEFLPADDGTVPALRMRGGTRLVRLADGPSTGR